MAAMQPSLDQLQLEKQQLHMFWQHQSQEMKQTTDFKQHQLPLARIKKIMKSDEEVKMISAEAPIIFAKACELFILELTFRSWIHTEENKRRTLQRSDVAGAINRADIFDFLVDIVPREEPKEEEFSTIGGGPWPLVRPCAPFGAMFDPNVSMQPMLHPLAQQHELMVNSNQPPIDSNGQVLYQMPHVNNFEPT